MCVAILLLDGKTLPVDDLRKCMSENPDGAGFMYNSNGKLIVQKGYRKFKKFYKAFTRARSANPKAHMVLHFRIATSGKKTFENCHPHLISPTLGVVHNGIIPMPDSQTAAKSDTAVFCDRILRHLPVGWHTDLEQLDTLSGLLGSNKLVMLDANGGYGIINMSSGTWTEAGIWFSNLYWRWSLSLSKSNPTNSLYRTPWEWEAREDDEPIGSIIDKYRCERCNERLPKDLHGTYVCYGCSDVPSL